MAKTSYPKPDWAVSQHIRSSGLVEDMCQHGIGHPNSAYILTHPDANAVHGCDGCCCDRNTKKKEAITLNLNVEKEAPKYNPLDATYEATFNFLQNGDTTQKETTQSLKVEVISCGSGHFLRITTGSKGWSVDNPQEFLKLLNFVAKVQSDNDQISGAPNANPNS